ncbi:MAG: Ppx/GppA phosphatase family protein [Syntrophomonadaceae bacterium]|nr:Ppx/GppA phosphatase family protein [Syntrophomonadaceae bacterium]
MRYGAVDIGTNSCRLLIAEKPSNQKVITLCKELDTTRMGEGITRASILKDEAIARTVSCLKHFRDRMREFRVDKHRVVATSAVREAGNREEFRKRVKTEVGLDIDIIDGYEEARLSYDGVIKGLNIPGSPLVVDLGGGSTEFICLDQKLVLSLPVGAVRAAEADMGAARIIEILNPLTKLNQDLRNQLLIMVGGTATSLVAIKKGLVKYDPEYVQGEILSRGEIGDLYNLLESMPLTLRRRLPGLQPERADIIHKGTLIILVIMEVLGHKEIIVSDTDLLEGIIWSMISNSSG